MMEHCKTCPYHEQLISIITKTTNDIGDIKADILDIKISIAERNAFLRGIRTTLKIIAAVISPIAAIMGYGEVVKILNSFSSW